MEMTKNVGKVVGLAWKDLARAHRMGLQLNESVIALGLCQGIQSRAPHLDVVYDSGKNVGGVSFPTLTVLSRDAEPRVLFVGKLLVDKSDDLACALAELPAREFSDDVQVLGQGKVLGEHVVLNVRVSSEYQVGLFVLPPSRKKPNVDSFEDLLTKDQLGRFICGWAVAQVNDQAHFDTSTINSTERREKSNQTKYPDFCVTLDNGRRVRVDTLIWEPSAHELIWVNELDAARAVVVKRMRKRASELFVGRKFLFRDLEEPAFNDPYIPQDSCMYVWLSSSPIDRGALYSELIVVISTNYQPDLTLEAIVWRAVHDVDWELHAEDVDERTALLWNEAWRRKTIH